MQPVVLPVAKLWDATGDLDATRLGDLSLEAAAALMRTTMVRFVVADPGLALLWISEADRFLFWKAEVKPNLADPNSVHSLDDFLRGYLYIASEWDAHPGRSIVLLEKHH